MKEKNSEYRERFRLTMEHKAVDRCPIDLGGTPQSTVDFPGVIVELARHLGFEGESPEGNRKFDRRVQKHFDVDIRRVGDMVPFENDRVKNVSETEQVTGLGLVLKYRSAGVVDRSTGDIG